MFCAPGVVSRGTEGVGSCFHVLRSQTRFRRYRERRVQLLCFARPDLFSAEPRASAPIFMFCVPELVSHGTEGVGSCFHVLISRTRFRLYGWCRVPFLCFTRPHSFTTIPRASGLVFMFCTPGLIFGCTEGVGSRFHVLRAQTHFRRNRWHRVLFSYFALSYSYSVVPRSSGPVFMFCAAGLIFGRYRGRRVPFHVLRSRTHFRRC
jgi:hypothetical protein